MRENRERELIQGAEGLTHGGGHWEGGWRSFQNSVLVEEEEGVSLRDPLWTCAEVGVLREQAYWRNCKRWGHSDVV